MLEKLIGPEIRELIEQQDFVTLAGCLNDWLPADLADLVADLGHLKQASILKSLKPALAASTFEHLDLPTQQRLLGSLSATDAATILNDMAPDDRTAFLEEVPKELSGRLLDLLDPEQAVVARGLLRYEEGSVGRLMTPDYVAIKGEWTVQDVLDHVRRHGRDSETLNVLYVIDDRSKLIDDLRIREILLTRPDANVRDIMDYRFVALGASEEKASAVEVFRKYDRTVLPVVDRAGTLLGIVTIDDVLDVAEERATKQMQRFGGQEALDESYVNTPFLALVRKRASWLVVLFLGEMLTATAMGHFEKEIDKAVVLTLFVPLIISSGGNSGSQAATLIIRALALGEIRLRDYWSVMRREVLSGLMLGTLLGSIGFVRIAAWSAFSGIYGPHWAPVGLTVALSLVGIVLWGTLSGSMLPFLLKRVGFDPAASSAPFVATLVDVTGLVIYFSVAMVVLRGTLL